ncbi:TPA: PTS transporter subunit EIIC [Escherichia coli]|nr:PTS transporter subunit EIIC [Escherichia coli]
MESSLRIVAITNCPAGIAHTYMVAEALEQKARSLGHTIKVETQGSSGVENRLSREEIAAADYVILATGRGLSGDDRARFAGKKVYEIAISQALKNIDQIFSELPTNSQLFAADSGVKLGKQEVQSGSVMSHLMAGVSAALPFVIGGGILVALANMLVQFGLPYTDMSKGAPSFTWVVESIGYLGFTFMIPIMGAYIASSIADKPAFAPAFLVCYLANDKALLGTQSGAGFLGAVVLGLAIGYFVFWFRKVRLGKALQPLLGSMLIPFVTLLVFGVLTYYVIGPVMSDLMGGLLHFLNTIPPSMKFAAAFLVGAMLAELLQTVNNPEITLYGVGSVEEEVGLRGAQTSAEHIKPDVVIVLDTAVAGDVPGIDNIKYPLKLGQGPGLMLFDKRYFPNQKLVAVLKNCAAHNDLPLQFSTMKTGATDGGRYNVMGGGRPVVALCLPTRYLHANSGMISKADYDALLTLIRDFLTTLTAEKVNAFSQFRQVD